MSDSGDDWEKQLEDDGELEKQLKQAEEEKKRAAFKDEDAYDSEEERKPNVGVSCCRSTAHLCIERFISTHALGCC